MNLRGGFLSFSKGFYRATALLLAVVLFVCISAADVRAEITGDEAFNNMQWEVVFDDSIQSAHGVIQSICCTDYYIITIENTTEDPNQPDTVSAYYKYPYDEYGNAVEQYALAKRVQDFDWEHGNGMTYNPRTGEIYVALYTSLRPENAGCIFVMDPDTLSFKHSIKIADGYNILGIEYLEESDEYMIITNDSGGYSIKRLDSNFQVIDDFGPTSTSPGVNYQDFCVDGDYLLISPLTFGMGIGEYINIFSISRRGIIQSAYFNPGDLGAQHYEPESICELEPGVFLMPVTATGYDGSMHVYFYRTVMPYYFTIEVTTQTVDAESMSGSENEDHPYNGDTMKADLAKTSAASDGKKTDLTKASAVSGGSVTTEVVKPADALAGKEKTDQAKAASVKSGLAGSDEYEASALAAVMEDTGGSVTEGSSQVLRGTGYAVNYTPNEGYETASVFVDGEEIDLAEYPDRYVIENIQENHTVDVTFAVKPTPVPTPTEEPQEITKPAQASGGDASENGDVSDEHTDASGTDAEKEESSKKAGGGFIAGIGGVFSSIGQLIKGAFAAVGGLFAGIGSLIMRGLRAVGAFFAGIPKFFAKPAAKGGKSVGSVVVKILLVILLLLLASLGLTAVHVQRVRRQKAEESKRRRARVRRQLEEEIEAIDIDSIPVPPPPAWQKPVTGRQSTLSKQNTVRKQQSQKRKRNKQQ